MEKFPQPPSEKRHQVQETAIALAQLKAARRLNCVTMIAALFAFISAIAVAYSVIEARIATIEANRAWIAPYGAQPIGVTKGGSILFEIDFWNTGRDPAQGLEWKFDGGTRPTPRDLDWSLISLGRNPNCDDLVPASQGEITYPTAPGMHPYRRRFDPGKNVLLVNIKNGNRVAFIRGCVAYKTMGTIKGKSAFCFVFEPIAPDNTGYIQGNSGLCDSGNWAE